MTSDQLIKFLMGVIGLVFGTLFFVIHIIVKKHSHDYFSHSKKAQSIIGHLKKYSLFMFSVFFYFISASGFISLILNN